MHSTKGPLSIQARCKLGSVPSGAAIYARPAACTGRAAAENGIPYLDTNSCFEGRELEDNIIFKTDTHPNAEANALFADAIGDFLTGIGLSGR